MSGYQYNLVMTKKGFVPITEIRKGTFVYCRGKWIQANTIEKRPVIKCTFKTLPTTSFEASLLKNYQPFSICHKQIYTKSDKDLFGMAVRGYFFEDKPNGAGTINDLSTLPYWLPRFTQFYNSAPLVNFNTHSYTIKCSRNRKFTKLEGDELSERNLEYYLEGYVRRYLFPHGNQILLGENEKTPLSESDKLVIRLLDIDFHQDTKKFVVLNNYKFLSHLKDAYNKNKIPEYIVIHTINNKPLPISYTENIFPISTEITEDWVIPDINPDINSISPIC